MFGDAVNCKAQEHALTVWPRESVGLVVSGEYTPVDNLAPDPKATFAFKPELLLTPGLQAIIHSHPHGNAAPSRLDMEQQIATALPWGIVASSEDKTEAVMWFGDQVDPPPLLGRPYRFGPSGSDGRGDCYAIIKDWFWLTKGVRLREVPRDEDGYRANTPWYETLFTSYGWKQIGTAEAKTGDVVLAKIMQNVTNHAMLILDHGFCLHHAENRLSREEPVGPWLKYATHVLRYDPA